MEREHQLSSYRVRNSPTDPRTTPCSLVRGRGTSAFFLQSQKHSPTDPRTTPCSLVRGKGTSAFFLQSQKQPHRPPHYTLQSCPWKGNISFLPTESETAPQTPTLHPAVLSVEREHQLSSYRVRNSPTDPPPLCSLVPCTQKPGTSSGPGELRCRRSCGVPRDSLEKQFTSSSPQISKLRGLFSQDRRIRRRVLHTVVQVRGLLRRPGAGIMEADDCQNMTTVFTVQPSFHHRHSTNRVS